MGGGEALWGSVAINMAEGTWGPVPTQNRGTYRTREVGKKQ